MKQLLIILAFLFIADITIAQNTVAKIKYEEAEEAFATKDYNQSIILLNEVEKILGSSNPKTSYLRIQAQHKKIESNKNADLENWADLKTNIAAYLSKYEKAKNLQDQYKDVYEINQNLPKYTITVQQVKDAQQGQLAAILKLADTYYNINSFEKAMQWYKQAASTGNAYAIFRIGGLYEDGAGVEKNYATANEWYQQASVKKYAVADYYSGGLYYMGMGVPKDQTKALSMFKNALPGINELAQKDDPFAHGALGALYLLGIAVEKDYAKSLQYYAKCANLGNAFAYRYIGYFYDMGLGVPKDLNKALEYYRTGASKDNGLCMLMLGNAYFMGTGVEVDKEKALEWIIKSAHTGNTDAMLSAAAIYIDGQVVNKDETKAAEWFLKAAQLGNVDAMTTIGNCYRDATGVNRDYAEARTWYEKAIAKNNDLDALRHLGSLYYEFDGYGNSIDYTKAAAYFTLAAEKGDGYSMEKLSVLHTSGLGVAKDKKLAKEWKNKAAAAKRQTPKTASIKR